MTVRQAIVPAYLVLALLIGGSSAGGLFANLLLQLLGMAIIVWVLWSNRAAVPSRHAAAALTLLGLMLALVIIQLVPLPPIVWTALPGRTGVANGLEMLGLELGWMPISLSPASTVASLMWLVPAVATLVGILLLGAFRDRWVALGIVSVAAVSVLVGAFQLAGGAGSPAYFYDRTNVGIAVGFFANGNHQATLLLVGLPFVAALYRHFGGRGERRRGATVTMLALSAGGLLLIGIAINGSLAGIGLAIPVALASLLLTGWRRLPSVRIVFPVVAVTTLLSAALVFLGPFNNNLFGADAQSDTDSRYTVFSRTISGAVDYFPFGSGTGTFVPVYKTFERNDEVTRFFMNNAHNDYLQLLLETGIPGLILMIVGIVWIGMRTVAIWRTADDNPLERAATIAIAAVLMHSMVDYPLRTAAISCVFAACIALIAKPRAESARRKRSGETRGVHLTA